MRGQKCIRPRCRRMQDSADYCRHHRNMLRTSGQAGLFDSAMAKHHILSLTARGVSLHRVARESGVGYSTVWRIVRGETTRARAATLRALMAAGVDRVRPGSAPAVGTRRRVQALIRIGWSYPLLTARTGLGQTTLRKVIYRQRISRELADRVAVVYAELENTPGPSVRAATVAASKGFAPPAAWDDDTIDDPRAKPQGVRRAA
jgi:lambda repressor-like predicted transcriptional regulator